MKVTITINGTPEQRDVEPQVTLLEFVRDVVGLKGTKDYCHSGVCGTCTVLADGAAVSACSLLAAQVDGKSITTVEGLEGPDGLHPIQQAFIDNFGLQCGYCTPGMMLLAKSLLEENPAPSREEIIRYMGGNLCRCTGYAGILRSVQAAADALSKG